jgi:archaeal type IV pilus assembly protein PilA
MKANQNFRRDDEAVSPVIGVILMVAITVVLAAVVFVLVNNLGEGAESAPVISFTKSESADSLSIVTASGGADWGRLSITLNAAGKVHDEEIAQSTDGTAATANTAMDIPGHTGAVLAGQSLYFCLTAAGPLTVTIVDVNANQIVTTQSFNSVDACP